MAISAGDLTLLRGQDIIVTPHLNVIPKVTVGTGQISADPNFFPRGTYLVDNLAFNGGVDLTNLDLGLMVWIGTAAGGRDVMVSTIRLNGVNNQIYVHGHSEGDPGVKMLEHVAVANNHYFTIFANSPLWAQLSRISGGTFYKKYNVAYGDEGSDPNPVCNVGKWRRLVLSGGQVDLDLTASNSHYWDKAASTWAWTFRNSSYALDGAGGAWQTAQNIVNPTVRFTSTGFYIVRCLITDSAGETHIAETNVWVEDGTNAVDLTGWRVEGDSQNRQGRKMTIRMYGDVAESVVFPGAAFLYTETSTYGGSSLTDGAVLDTFVGYIDEEAGIRNVGNGQVEFDLLSPAHVLDQIAMAPQYIQEVSSPANWTEVDSSLSNPNGVAWYVLAHHAPNFTKKFDFIPLGDTELRDHNWVFNKKSVWGQLKEIAPRQINIGCISEGAMYLRHDPLLMDAADRNALDVQMTWTAQDIRGDEGLSYPAGYRLDVGQEDGYAFSYNGTSTIPYWSRAPGDMQAPGRSKNVTNGMIVPLTGGQTRVNEIAGHLFAKANNPTPALQIPAKRNFDTADPALMIWHKLTIADALDPRGSGYTDRRFLPVSVSRRWQQVNDKDWLKTVNITMEAETTGVEGITKPIPAGVDGSWYPGLDWPAFGDFQTLEVPNEEERTTPIYVIVGHRHEAKIALGVQAAGLGSGAPVYTNISTGLAGNVRWMTADPFNYQRYFAVTTSGLYRCDNVFAATPIWTQVLDNSLITPGNWNNYHHIVMSGHRQGWIMLLASFYQVHVSFDYGLNWIINPVFTTADTSDEKYLGQLHPGVHNVVDGDSRVFCACAGSIYYNTEWGATGSWTVVNNAGHGANSGDICTVPFMRDDFTANIPDASQQLFETNGWVLSPNPDRAWHVYRTRNFGTAWTQILAGVGAGSWDASWASPSMRSLVDYTLDSNRLFIAKQTVGQVNRNARVDYSDDQGDNFTVCTNQPGGGGTIGTNMHTVNINGWPYNKDFCLCWWERTNGGITGGLAATEDKGDTAWQSLTGNLVSGGIFGDMRIAYAEAVLGAIQ